MSLRSGTIEGRTSRSGATSFGPDPIIASNTPKNRVSTSDRRPPVRAAALDLDGDEADIELGEEGEVNMAVEQGGRKGVDWEVRMARRYRRWTHVIDSCHSSLVTHHPLALDLKQDTFQYQLHRMQDSV